MSEFVGVIHGDEYLFSTIPDEIVKERGEPLIPQLSLKREAMIFQKIAIPQWSILAETLKWAGKSLVMNEYLDFTELDWLIEQGVVFSPEAHIYENQYEKTIHRHLETEEHHKFRHQQKQLRERMDLLSDKLKRQKDAIDNLYPYDDYWKGVHEKWKKEYEALNEEFGEIWDREREVDKRIIATALRGCNFDAVPILVHPAPFTLSSQTTKTDIIKIVINALPIPDETTPWEHIVEYRSDPDSYTKFLALRNWMVDVSQSNLTPLEIEQKLEFLIDKYQQHMKLHKMKVNTGAIQTLIVSTAEIIEDLIKFKWGKLAKSMFSFKERKIALLEGELTAPGSEVAYVVKAQEEFGDS